MNWKRNLKESYRTNSYETIIDIDRPTAVGKTELSLSLHRAVNGEIVSADSMQVYKKKWISDQPRFRPKEIGGCSASPD